MQVKHNAQAHDVSVTFLQFHFALITIVYWYVKQACQDYEQLGHLEIVCATNTLKSPAQMSMDARRI